MTTSSQKSFASSTPNGRFGYKTANDLYPNVSVAYCASAVASAQDSLPSWNDTAPKKAIVAFVEKATKDGNAGQRQHELEGSLRRRLLVEGQLELEPLRIEGEDPAASDPTADDAHAKPIADRRAQDLLRVPAATSSDLRAATLGVPFRRLDEQAIHALDLTNTVA